jgi:ParB-like chromosome segregation protein Spo0J
MQIFFGSLQSNSFAGNSDPDKKLATDSIHGLSLQERALKVDLIPIEKVIPYAKNPRRNEAAIAKVAGSIKEFGFRQPIVVDSEMVVIAGHTRLEAARSLGIANVPVHIAEGLSKSQIKAYRIADNRVAQEAEWDLDLLKIELSELRDEEFDLSETGFDEDELNDLLAEAVAEGLTDEDAVPEPPPEPITKLGDIWILGKHRLMCGDSTSVDAVERLMAGERPRMVFTDPPYGIAHSGKGITANGVGNDFGQILGDEDVSVAIDTFRLCVGQWPEARMVFWGANYYPSALPDGHGWLVWDKQREGDTFSGAELAFINGGVRVDVFRHMWHGMVKASEHGQKRIHPTQKPIALAEWCFAKYGDSSTVLDLFGGSGSTLIACEKTGRSCRMMELDPKYCDVIVKRWEEFTGKKARLENGSGDLRTGDDLQAA